MLHVILISWRTSLFIQSDVKGFKKEEFKTKREKTESKSKFNSFVVVLIIQTPVHCPKK